MQQRIIDPPKDQWYRLPTPLTDGENKVYNLFDAGLPLEWEMYIQPHLNGLRPDLVLLNPYAGVAVFEIKDWSPNTLESSIKYNQTTKNPINKIRLYEDEIFNLYCPRLDDHSGKAVITAGLIFTQVSQDEVNHLLQPFRDRNMRKYPDQYPFSGSEGIVESNMDVLFPEQKKWGRQKQSCIMSADIADDLRGWLKEPAFSQEQREPLDINTQDRQQRLIITNPGGVRYRRVKGPAGSGKSLALAARGAELANQGKRVLICTFNITLMNYLRDLVARHTRELAARQIVNSQIRQQIEYRHFHGWFRHICIATGYKMDYDQLWDEFFLRFVVRGFGPNITENDLRRYFERVGQVEEVTISVRRGIRQESSSFSNTNYAIVKMTNPQDANVAVGMQDHSLEGNILHVKREEEILNKHMPKLVEQIYQDPTVSDVRPIYDAILVDEGQDYCPVWWDTLRKAVKPDEEMLLVADKTQDIYGTAGVWTEEAMIGAGFSGDWMRLNTSYRLPDEIAPILKDFANNFLVPSGVEVDISEDEPIEPECDPLIEFRWVQVSSEDLIAEVCFEEVNRQMQSLRSDTAIPDIIFLSQNIDVGLEFVEKCKQYMDGRASYLAKEPLLHTFVPDDEETNTSDPEDKDFRKNQESRRRKLAFFLGKARIKATTLHSFKGWEARHLVLHISRIASAEDRALFYTALTRLKKHSNGSMLTVVSSCPDPDIYNFGERNFRPNFFSR